MERETKRKDFLVFIFNSEKCKYFACDLIFRIMNKSFRTSGSNNTSGEIGEQSFGYTFFLSPMNTYVKY